MLKRMDKQKTTNKDSFNPYSKLKKVYKLDTPTMEKFTWLNLFKIYLPND